MDGTRGIRGALGARVRGSPTRVRGREPKRAASPRPTPRGRDSCRAQGARASSQCARLAARRAVPLAASAALRLSETLPLLGAEPRPLRSAPSEQDLPGRFPKQTLRCTRAHTLSHTHSLTHTMPPCGAHSGSPLGFSAPGAVLSFLLLGRGWVTSPRRPGNSGGRTEGKGKRRGSRAGSGQVLGHAGSRRGGGETRGVAGRRVPGRAQVPPQGGSALAAAGEGGERRRNPALGGLAAGNDPTVRSPPAPPAPLPPPRARGRFRAAGPPRSLFLSSSPSHVRAGSGFCPDFL